MYSDSEEKIGVSISAERNKFFLATKTTAQKASLFWENLETSLRLLKTDYIDIYQFHNPGFVPRPGDESGLYDAALKAREQGKIRFIGITNHAIPIAREAAESGLYDTVQFPFSYLSNDDEIALTKLCAEKNVGFIAMKALAGGLIADIASARAYLNTFPNVVPIFGIQKQAELDQLFDAEQTDGKLTKEQQAKIAKDRAEISGEFCRSCGYCMPCPQGILIHNCARMGLMLRRSPSKNWLTPEWQAEMAKIDTCIHCNNCKSKCPYHLDTPALLEKNRKDYLTFLK
jgi:predicted aldo/keto reductase-like oxidoreductase